MGDRQQRIKAVKTKSSDIVLVCRKCSKKLRGGFGPDGDRSLGKALRQEVSRAADAGRPADKRSRNRLLVLEIGCQDLCPKQAVVACRPGVKNRWIIVPKGMPIGLVAAELEIATATTAPDRSAVNVPAASGTGHRTEPFSDGRA